MVVYESFWGNTRSIAQAIAAALGADVEVVHVEDAPSELPADLDLLVIGAPTHAFALPTAASRAEAAKFGGTGSTTGVREWLDRLPAPQRQPLVAVFDTRQGTSVFVGSAAKSTVKRLHKNGLVVGDTANFVVTQREGPLADGELEHAAEWARTLRNRLG